MKINLAKSAGFCFGVKRALNIALKTANLRKNVYMKNIYMLGDIVHNEDVVKQINKEGIKKIKKLPSVNNSGKNKILLIRAHGTSKEMIKKTRKLGYKIVDATCPMVKEIHRIVRNAEKKGYSIIIIGDKKHDEVQGIIGQLKSKATVIQSLEDIPLRRIKRIKKACIVAQSTQNLDKVYKIVEILKPNLEDLKFFNTICIPTRLKQEEIKRMPLENDAMIVIGSKTSANTKRLYEISKSLNPKTYWIKSKKEIRRMWLKGAKSVGITAGASTPDLTTQKVVRYVKQIR